MLDHLPERDRPAVKARLRRAWASENHALALDGLRALAGELEHSHPGAAASLSEGLEETLTLTRLGIRGRLKKTLALDEPDRVHDPRSSAAHHATSSAGKTGTCACGGPPPGCSRPRPNSARSSATPTSPNSPSPSSATSSRNAPPFTPRPERRPHRSPSPCKPSHPTAATNFYGERDNLPPRWRWPSADAASPPARPFRASYAVTCRNRWKTRLTGALRSPSDRTLACAPGLLAGIAALGVKGLIARARKRLAR